MSLKVEKSIKFYIPRILIGLVVILLAAFIIRVAIWEKNYYAEKEGSERAVTQFVGDMNVDPETIVTDEVITEQEVKEYVVPADMPRYITIPRIGITRARIVEKGTLSNGQMAAPNNNYDVAWWNGSDKPNTGGTAILNGHNGANTYGVFKQLPKLVAGDQIVIEMGDGTVLTYRVHDNAAYTVEEANKKISMLAVSPEEGTESISLITCTGEWSYNEQAFLSRQFLRATLVSVSQ